jgi:hypothetical protein
MNEPDQSLTIEEHERAVARIEKALADQDASLRAAIAQADPRRRVPVSLDDACRLADLCTPPQRTSPRAGGALGGRRGVRC